MKKFLVTYLAPASVIDDWKKTEAKQRKEAEEKIRRLEKWMGDHSKMFADKGPGSERPSVSPQGTKTQETTSCCMRSSMQSHTMRRKASKAIRTCRSRRPR